MELGKLHQRRVFGGYSVPYKATNVLCSDGVRRTAYTAQEADTYFSLPARVRVRHNGRQVTVSGFITAFENTEAEHDYAPDYKFIAYSYRKNGHLLS